MTDAARPAAPAEVVRLSDPRGRLTLLVTVVASGMAFLDGTVVNVALPRLGEDLDASLAGLQWTVNGYMLSLAALILLGGALGDRLGRRRMLVVGTGWFGLASAACALAPNLELLVAARVLQGVAAALLTPASLAVLQAGMHPDDRAKAIGAWSGLSGVTTAFGPFLGGWLVDAGGWRWVFVINVPLAVLVVLLGRSVPESSDPQAAAPRFDVAGAALGAVALAGVSYALIAAPEGGSDPDVVVSATVGVVAGLAFLVVESRTAFPMLPLSLFGSRQFSAVNAATLLVYAALSGVFFFLVVQLQVAGWSPLAAGTATVPVTLLLLVLSPSAGALAQKVGPRLPMTVGPLLCAVGLVLLTRVGTDVGYVVDVLPGVTMLGLGLATTVAPLTAAALGAVETRRAGVASGVNNAVARTAGLLAVAALPLVVGLSGADYLDADAFTDGYRGAMLVCAALMAGGALISLLGVRGRLQDAEDPAGPGEP